MTSTHTAVWVLDLLSLSVYCSHESCDSECHLNPCQRLRGPRCPTHALSLLLSPLLSRCECVWLSPRPAWASLLHQIPLHCFTIKGSRWKPGEAALLPKILLRKFFDLHSQSFAPPPLLPVCLALFCCLTSSGSLPFSIQLASHLNSFH